MLGRSCHPTVMGKCLKSRQASQSYMQCARLLPLVGVQPLSQTCFNTLTYMVHNVSRQCIAYVRWRAGTGMPVLRSTRPVWCLRHAMHTWSVCAVTVTLAYTCMTQERCVVLHAARWSACMAATGHAMICHRRRQTVCWQLSQPAKPLQVPLPAAASKSLASR